MRCNKPLWAAKVQQALRRRKVSQRFLAVEIGVGECHLSGILNGNRESPKLKAKILDYLNVEGE